MSEKPYPTLDALVKAVTEEPDVQTGVALLAKGLGQLVQDAGVDPNRVLSFARSIAMKAEELAAAVVANSPVAPAPVRNPADGPPPEEPPPAA